MRKLLFTLVIVLSFFTSNGQKAKLEKSAGVTLSLPLVTQCTFYNYNDNKQDKTASNLGAGFGLFYRKNRNKFSLAYENPIVDSKVSVGGGFDLMTHLFELTMLHNFHRLFAVVAGLNYTIYKFHSKADYPPFSEINKNDPTIGLTTGIEFFPIPNASIALSYRPSLFSSDKKSYRTNLFYRLAFVMI